VVALTLVGGGLRFATLDVQSFDSDEAFGVSRVLDGSLGHLFAALPETESNPPTYYVLAWLWGQLFGFGEVGIRSLSALVGTAVIPVVYLAGRELATRRAGLVAAAFAAVNPLLIFYAQEARNFALLTLCASLSIWFLARVLQEPSWRRLALWSGACVLAVSVHYFAGFLFVAEVAVLIAFVRPMPPAVLAALPPVVVSLAFTPLALSQADGRTEWISNQPLLTRAHQVVSKFFVGDVDPISNGLLLLIAVPLVTAIGYGLAISGPRERRGGLIALALAGGAVALTLAVDVAGGHYLIARNVIWALPATLVGIGAFLGAHRAGRWGPAAAATACGLSLAIAVATPLDPRLQRPDFRGVAEAIGAPSQDMALVIPYFGRAPIEHYLPGATVQPRSVSVARLELVTPLNRRDSGRPAREPTPPPPRGFVLVRRDEARGYTRIVYRAPTHRSVSAESMWSLLPRDYASQAPEVLTWPRATVNVSDRR
jgi:hypothetical protein